MESLLVELEQSFTPRKQIKTPKWKTHQHVNNHLHHLNNISRQGSLTQNYAQPQPQPQAQHPQVLMHDLDLMMMHGGLPFNNHHAPPYHHISNSLPPMPLAHHHNRQPPPLLPLPTVSRPAFRSLPPHRQLPSIKTPTKKHKIPSAKKENIKKGSHKNNNDNLVQFNSVMHEKTKVITTEPKKESGPDPGTLAKDLTRMLLADLDSVTVVEMDKFSGSVFSLAPPPSSLPLPRFSLRQPPRHKLSCNAEAEVADGGASDNLCKLLKLR